MSETSPRTQDELHPLTILRFFVSIWIVLSHFCGSWSLPSNAICDRTLAFLHSGGTGVKIFFFLSGFILVFVYSKRSVLRPKDFWIARFSRLYPLYLVGLAIAVPDLLGQIGQHVAHHGFALGLAVAAGKGVLVLLMLQAWSPSAALYWNGPAWSLSCEATFYAAFPFLLRRIRNVGIGAIVALFALSTLAEMARMGRWESSGNLFYNLSPLTRLPDFLSGLALGALYARGARLPPICAVPAALATILGSMFPEWPMLLRGPLVHLGAAALILSLAFPLRARPNRALAAALVLGQSSYAIYLIHQPLQLDLYLGPFRWLGVPPHSQAVSLLVIIACAVALYLWVEVPARNWLRWKILGSNDR